MSPSQKKVSVFTSDYMFQDSGVPDSENDVSPHLINSNSGSICPFCVCVFSERQHAHSSRPGEAADERAFQTVQRSGG